MSDSNLWTSATPLRNEDFRKLLFTPRPHGSTGGNSKQQKPTRPKPAPKFDDSKPKKPPKPNSASAAKPIAEEEAEDHSLYRDRAKERREGVNLDYQEIEEELAHVLQDKGLGHDLNKISIDESKFLGGDLKHTHLVKGLDFALLQKERTKLQKQEEEEVKDKDKKERLRKEDLNIRTPLAKSVFDTLFNPKRSDVKEMLKPRRMAFVYNFEKDVDDPAFNSDIPMTLIRSKADCPPVQEMVMGNVDSHVLDRIMQILSYMKFSQSGKGSKKMKKKDKEELLMALDATPRGQNGAQVLMKFPAKGQQQQQKEQPVPDDDIFEDAGTDYVPSAPDKSRAREGGHKVQLFDKPEDIRSTPANDRKRAQDAEDGEVPPPPPPPPPPSAPYPGDPYAPQAHPNGYEAYGQEQYGYAQYGYGQHEGYGGQTAHDPYAQAYQLQAGGYPGTADVSMQPAADGQEDEDLRELTQEELDAGLGSVFKSDKAKWKAKPNTNKEKDLGFGDEAYQECFPEYHEYAAEIADSDDEDLSKMDARGKGASRYDFNTEEEWQQYKEQREAMPKAAFQFGVKVSDGRKSHKGLEKHKQQKLDNELHKIERILKDKGHEHGGAFRKTAPHEDQAHATPAMYKRQRI